MMTNRTRGIQRPPTMERIRPIFSHGMFMIAALLVLSMTARAASSRRGTACVCFAEGSGPIRFAAEDLRDALVEAGYAVQCRPGAAATCVSEADSNGAGPGPSPRMWRIRLFAWPQRNAWTSADGLNERETALFGSPETFVIRRHGRDIDIIGSDANGTMYGGLDLGETVRLTGSLEAADDRTAKPSIARRGIKFNIPLDARTPSYDDTGDAAQTNIPHMWEFDFWTRFLDAMARDRYNTLTLWNPHPFPSLVRCPDYPEVALDDVCVTTLKPTYQNKLWRAPQFVGPEVVANLRVVKKMSINEKIVFWRKVMRYAKDRGIDIYFITWNVLVNGAEGKYGITDEQTNPKTIAYLRQSVRELILTYPDLAGIGVTAGEHMQNRNDEYDREKWLWQTYGMGVLDAKKIQPKRTVRFIHRVWNTGLEKIMRDFAAHYPDPFEIGFKYARAHMYSSPSPPFAQGLLKEMEPYDVKCWWNLRNDDIFVFRWGDPEYTRAFLRNLPPADKTAGYHMGSDGYVWGVEFSSRNPARPGRLEIEKHWYKFLLWGRLGYDLDLPADRIQGLIAKRFDLSADQAAALYRAWAAASQVIPQINRFHWRNWDFMWAPEGCMDLRTGFHDVRMFIETPPMEASGIVGIPEYVAAKVENRAIEGISPPAVATNLEACATTALDGVNGLRQDDLAAGELAETLNDIEAMAHLGRYYAAKIRGATALCLFEKTGRAEYREQAITQLQAGIDHWQAYARIAAAQYKPQLLARTRDLDWWALWEDVKKDVTIAEQAKAQ